MSQKFTHVFLRPVNDTYPDYEKNKKNLFIASLIETSALITGVVLVPFHALHAVFVVPVKQLRKKNIINNPNYSISKKTIEVSKAIFIEIFKMPANLFLGLYCSIFLEPLYIADSLRRKIIKPFQWSEKSC